MNITRETFKADFARVKFFVFKINKGCSVSFVMTCFEKWIHHDSSKKRKLWWPTSQAIVIIAKPNIRG